MQPIVNTKAELISLLIKHQGRILQYGVKQLGLFGSFVRNEAKQDSDIDFLIEFYPEHKTLKNLVRLSDTLEEITGRKVEVVTLQSLSKYIGPYILNEVEYVPIAN
jgi:hypothetical protein